MRFSNLGSSSHNGISSYEQLSVTDADQRLEQEKQVKMVNVLNYAKKARYVSASAVPLTRTLSQCNNNNLFLQVCGNNK